MKWVNMRKNCWGGSSGSQCSARAPPCALNICGTCGVDIGVLSRPLPPVGCEHQVESASSCSCQRHTGEETCWLWSTMAWCDRGVQTLLATAGAFAAFSLMTIAIGTDYWLYSRAYICNGTNVTTEESLPQQRSKKGDLTHSGLWRICCIEGKSL